MIDHETTLAGRPPSRRPALRARPQSWHPYGPVEPPLELPTSRPIGVHAILNPPTQGVTDPAVSSREPLNLPGPSSPRPRQGSPPSIRSARHLAQQPLSPRSRSRPSMNPTSPPPRFIGSGRTSGRSSISHSPLVPQEASLGPTPPASSSPLPLDTAMRPAPLLPGTHPSSTSVHSKPSSHARRTSTGLGPLPIPNSQRVSPGAQQSSYNHFGRASPAGTSVSLPPTTAPTPHPAYVTTTSLARGTPAPAVPHSTIEDSTGSTGTPGSSASASLDTLIPCVLDLKSGSSSQAEKRKANSDASRRFRNRKRNEMQLEQRLNSQQDEIQRHAETIRRQSEDLRVIAQQRDHYRSERDFFRDQLGRSMSLSRLSSRPPTPHPALTPRHLDDTSVAAAWADVPRPVSGTQVPALPGAKSQEIGDSTRPQNSWPGSPASYSPAPPGLPPAGRTQAPVPPPMGGGPPPPFQGTWSRP